MSHRSLWSFLTLLMFALAAPVARASMQTAIDDNIVSGLRHPLRGGARIKVHNIPLADGSLETIDLEAFSVVAPDAVLAIYGDDGGVTRTGFPKTRYFRGAVAGDAASMAVFAVRETGEVAGFVVNRNRKFAISTHHFQPRQKGEASEDRVLVDEVSIVDDMDALAAGAFHCDVEHASLRLDDRSLLPAPESTLKPAPNLSTTATRYLRLAVDTDHELYVQRGNSATSVANYITDLMAAANTIYMRDLKTELTLVYSSVYATASDPFNIVPTAAGNPSTLDALAEFGAYWHNTPPYTGLRSGAILVSGKRFPDSTGSAGIAWLDRACSGDRAAATTNVPGGYSGAYAFFNGASANSSSEAVANPNANPNFQATTTVFDNSYWTLMAFTHEFGHVYGSVHTHCVQLTAAEQVTYGRTFVDQCHSGETACYSGPTSVPPELGTIMSYCHLLGYGPATRFTFGQPGEPTHNVVDNMLASLTPRIPDFSGIAVLPTLTQGAAASASVSATAPTRGGSISGYQWTLTNATINGSATASSVNFTPTGTPVTLKVVVTATTGCASSDSLSIPATPAVTLMHRGDFGGDGKADILLRDSAGGIGIWSMNGTAIISGARVSTAPGYTIAGIGDFNGDGKADILLLDSSGGIGMWLMNGAAIIAGASVGSAPGYTIAGIGDFNGDGKDDVVLRDSNGNLGMWFMNGPAITAGASIGSAPGYTVAGVGDFNSDGKADILLRDTNGNIGLWLMNGSVIVSGAFVGAASGYTIAGVADFNGDGKADILLRDANGNIGMWLMNGPAILSGASVGAASGLTVVATKDYNGDGKADVLLRDANGNLGMWLMNGPSIVSGGALGGPGSGYTEY